MEQTDRLSTYEIGGPLADQDAAAIDLADLPRGLGDAAPDYPEALAFTAARHFRAAAGRQVSHIVIHITCGQPDYRRTVSYFQDPTRDGKPVFASAHYVVGQGGEVVQMVSHDNVAYHAGKANAYSIGIEHCARPAGEWGRDDAGFPVSEAQYRASARLVRWLCGQYGLPADRSHILGHAEADPGTTHTNCPLGAWDWDHFLELVWQEPVT